MPKLNKEFLMWEKVFSDCHVQCTWKDSIYIVVIKVGNITKAGTFNQQEKPSFGSMNSKDREMSTMLTNKLLNEIKQQQEKEKKDNVQT